MDIQLPTHVIDILRSRGLTGEPDNWQFKAARLSANRVYLWFTCNDGFVLNEGQWQSLCMAKAVLTSSDAITLRLTTLPLHTLQKPNATVEVYQDGSIAWPVDGVRHPVDWRDGQALAELNTWRYGAYKKSQALWTKVICQSLVYTQLAEAMASLAQTMERLMHQRR